MTVVLLDFSISLEEFQWEKSILVISEILRPFVNTFTPDDKYSVGTTYRNQFKWNYIKTKVFFSMFYSISEICI